MADQWDEGDSDNDSQSNDQSHGDVVQFSLSQSEELHSDPSYKPKKLKKSGSIIENQDFEYLTEQYSRVLVLYTGGTIGMKSNFSGKNLISLLPI